MMLFGLVSIDVYPFPVSHKGLGGHLGDVGDGGNWQHALTPRSFYKTGTKL